MPAADAILEVLMTIPDPEMPIYIVDLGLIEDLQSERAWRWCRDKEGAAA